MERFAEPPADDERESREPSRGGPYYVMFTLPAAGPPAGWPPAAGVTGAAAVLGNWLFRVAGEGETGKQRAIAYGGGGNALGAVGAWRFNARDVLSIPP